MRTKVSMNDLIQRDRWLFFKPFSYYNFIIFYYLKKKRFRFVENTFKTVNEYHYITCLTRNTYTCTPTVPRRWSLSKFCPCFSGPGGKIYDNR